MGVLEQAKGKASRDLWSRFFHMYSFVVSGRVPTEKGCGTEFHGWEKSIQLGCLIFWSSGAGFGVGDFL